MDTSALRSQLESTAPGKTEVAVAPQIRGAPTEPQM